MHRHWLAGWAFLIVTVLATAGGSNLIKKEDVPKAIELLRKGTVTQRVKAADDLGARGAVRVTDVIAAVEPLQLALKRDGEPRVRAAAALALGKIQHEPEKLVPVLTEALKDKDVSVKMAVINALGALGPQARSALPELRKAGSANDKKLMAAIKMAVKNINKKGQ